METQTETSTTSTTKTITTPRGSYELKYDLRTLKAQIKELNVQIRALKDNLHQPYESWKLNAQNELLNLKHQATLLHMARAQAVGHLHCSRYTRGLGNGPLFYGWQHSYPVDMELQAKLTDKILKSIELKTSETKAA